MNKPKLTKTGRTGQGFDENFVEFCQILAYLAAAPKGRRIGTEELIQQTGYTKQVRSLQRLLLKVSRQTLGLLANDGCTPRGWWLEADLGTIIQKIGEIQNVKD